MCPSIAEKPTSLSTCTSSVANPMMNPYAGMPSHADLSAVMQMGGMMPSMMPSMMPPSMPMMPPGMMPGKECLLFTIGLLFKSVMCKTVC